MANQRHVAKLKKGVDVWNQWAKLSGERADLRDADLTGMNLEGFYLKEAQLKGAKLNKANLQKAKLDNAYMRRANLTGANLREASLSGANLRHAVLRKAKLNKAYLRRADFSYVDFRGADLTESVLEYARLVDVDLGNATLKDCFIYGASVWNLLGTPKEQSNLVITPSIVKRDRATPRLQLKGLHTEPTITVDDLEIAQFIYLLLNYKSLRNTINSVTEKGVLLLGRFGGGGLALLQAMGAELREMGYLPIIFDFDRPEDRDYTETIQTLTGLSRFVIVDLSGPSVPQELYSIVPHIKIPYVPIIEKGRETFSLFSGLLQYPWVVRPILEFANEGQLLKSLAKKVVAPAEKKYKERKKLLKQIFGSRTDA
jgi:hypothetical protein